MTGAHSEFNGCKAEYIEASIILSLSIRARRLFTHVIKTCHKMFLISLIFHYVGYVQFEQHEGLNPTNGSKLGGISQLSSSNFVAL